MTDSILVPRELLEAWANYGDGNITAEGLSFRAYQILTRNASEPRPGDACQSCGGCGYLGNSDEGACPSCHGVGGAISEPKPVEDAIPVAWMLDGAVGGSTLDFQISDLLDSQNRYGGVMVPLYRARPAPAGVVDMLRKALPFLEQHNDEGPTGEGWQSDELTDLVYAITVELNGAPK